MKKVNASGLAPLAAERMFMTRFAPVWAGGVMAMFCVIVAVIRPLFHDEASTIYFAGEGVQHLFAMLRQDVHPPGYFLFALACLKVFEDSYFALRVMSALFMGGAVYLFLRGLRCWLGRYPSIPAMSLISISPFLIFCGYFARYYALVCLLWAACFWALGWARRNPCPLKCAAVGVLGALTFLTNYAATVVAVAGVLPFAFEMVRARRWRSLIGLAVPGLVAFAAWFPMLRAQLTVDLPGRWDGESMVTAGRVVKNAGFLAWSLAVSDGLPPWSVGGLVLAPVLHVCAGVTVWRCLASGNVSGDYGNLRHLTVSALMMLAAGVVVGLLFLPGPMYSFLPPRVALCGFAWLVLLVVIPDCLYGQGKFYMYALLAAHACGAIQLLSLLNTTNWAYQVPVNAIVRTVSSYAVNHEGLDAVYLPRKSIGNIRFGLEKWIKAGPRDVELLPTTTDSVASATQILVIRDSRMPEWPPSKAVNDPGLVNPAGNWTRIESDVLVQETGEAGKIKRLFSGSEVRTDKIRLDVWRRE